MTAHAYRRDGSFRSDEARKRIRSLHTLINQLPDALDRIDTDAVRACSQLLSNIIARSKRQPLPTFEQPKHLANRLTIPTIKDRQ